MAEVSAADHIVAARPQEYQPYDATSDGDVGGWSKLPGGPCDLSTGELTGDDFPSSGRWQQC